MRRFTEKKIKIVDLDITSFTEEEMESTADPTLNFYGKEGIEIVPISETLTKTSSLTNLNLNSCFIGEQGMHILSEALKLNTTVTHLNLTNNRIGVPGVGYLSDALKLNRSLNTLLLGCNSIGNEGVKLLCDALLVNNSLTNLILPTNEIGDEGMAILCETLKVNTCIASLNLASNQIKSPMSGLAEVLAHSSSLAKIVLRGNFISNEGGLRIQKSIKNNRTLTFLDISFNGVTRMIQDDINSKLDERIWIKKIDPTVECVLQYYRIMGESLHLTKKTITAHLSGDHM